MFGLMIIGGEYDGQFACDKGLLTKDVNEAMKFQNKYWANNISYNWNKYSHSDECTWIPVEFYFDINGKICYRKLKCPE